MIKMAMYEDDPTDVGTDEACSEVVAGREPPPHTQAPDWVSFADISPLAGKLHTLLKAHVNQARGDSMAWPSTRSLAKMLHLCRRDKVAPLLKELVKLGAIEIRRAKTIPARNIYVVHSLPPEGYTGPLSVSDWYDRNREALKREAEADQKKREERSKRNKKAATAPAVALVTPPEGQLGFPDISPPVTPVEGYSDTPVEGHRVTPPQGRKQDEVEPDEQKNKKPPAHAVGEDASHFVEASEGQITIDGSTEATVKVREYTNRDIANEIARNWLAYWADPERNTPIAGEPRILQAKMVSAVLGSLNSGYTRLEVGNALKRIAEPTIPSSPRLQRELAAGRGYKPPRQNPNQRWGSTRGAGADVNAHWDEKYPIDPETVVPGVPVGAIAGIMSGGDPW